MRALLVQVEYVDKVTSLSLGTKWITRAKLAGYAAQWSQVIVIIGVDGMTRVVL